MAWIEKTGVGLLNAIAAMWAFALAFIILADIIGRVVGYSIQGTAELVANSIVAIVFLQFPLAVSRGAFLRTTVIYDLSRPWVKASIDLISYLMGAVLFIAIALGGWDDMVTGFRIGEFEGEGALRVPVYPVRGVIFTMSVVTVLCYLMLIINRVRKCVPCLTSVPKAEV